MPLPRAAVFTATVLALAATMFAPVRPATADVSSAVVFAYTRFGEDATPANSIRLDQFEAHIQELKTGGYAVLPLPDIVAALRAGKPLPDRAIAITIDDPSRSAVREAWPRLRAAGLPFTVFVATDMVDQGAGNHVTWDELRQMAGSGVTIAGLGASPQSLVSKSRTQIRGELARMGERLGQELGVKPELFAYPQGEYSAAIRSVVEGQGYLAAFGQQSGVVHPSADFRALPRFLMNEAYGSIDRFRLAANALPLAVSEVAPDDPVLVANPPLLGFTVAEDAGDLSRLACFASGQGRSAVERVTDTRVEVRIADAFPPGRARVNCTLPTADGRWRWFGVQFLAPE
jgi:peptidoglycan/xylan/chitin deacetylase (PgdA/CDA1 family)